MRLLRTTALLVLLACGGSPPPPPPSAPVAVDVSPAPSPASSEAQSPPPNPDRFHEPPATDPPEENHGVPAPPPTGYLGGVPPFNRSAAAAALQGAQIQRCALPGGPTGMGHVTVVFDPNGTVGAVTIDQPPFAGTPTGGCLARVYGTLTVPPYSGTPVRVGKTFNLP